MNTNQKIWGHHKAYFLIIVLAMFFYEKSSAQTLDEGRYYIKNMETGLVLEVKGGVIMEGNTVRPHALNHTRAQIFTIERNDGSDNNSLNSYYIKNRGPGQEYFLTAKKRLSVTDGGQAASLSPEPNDHFPPNTLNLSQGILGEKESTNHPGRTLKNYIITFENKTSDGGNLSVSTTSQLFGGFHQEWEIIPMGNKSYRIVNSALGQNMMLLPEIIDNGTSLVFSNSATSNLFRWEILSVDPVAPELQKITFADVAIKTPPIYKFWRNDKLEITLRWNDSDAVEYSVWLVNSDGSDSELKSHISGKERSYKYKEDMIGAGGIPKRCFRIVKKNVWNNSVSSEHQCFEAFVQVPNKS